MIRAPEINKNGLTWFNTDHPLGLEDLRGRLVILDFWTYCCINCLHVLPALRRIEDAFPDEVTVIGVHSPKFPAEQSVENVAQAVARLDIHHPVVHDPYMSLWDDYAIRAWPTLVVLSPDGYVIGQSSGEPDPDSLMAGIEALLAQFRDDGSLIPCLSLEPAKPVTKPHSQDRLRFPGKIKAAGGKAWAVADAGHHQIALFDDQGGKMDRWGSGHPGFVDGDAATACFRGPQGLAADDTAIWVADTGNHALRRIDRASGYVETVAGTGERGPILHQAETASGCALASPWDVEVVDGKVLIANAGTHQILSFDPVTGQIVPVAGTGGENLRDGPAGASLLAQPSGLARASGLVGASGDGQVIYFADAETSAVRCLDLADHQVETLVGQGLFDFGTADGGFDDALLQHPLAVAVDDDGTVLAADSYNGLIRRLDPKTRTVSTVPLGECADPVCLPLGEPAGLAVAGPGRVLLSDTNNHRILEIDLTEGTYRRWA